MGVRGIYLEMFKNADLYWRFNSLESTFENKIMEDKDLKVIRIIGWINEDEIIECC